MIVLDGVAHITAREAAELLAPDVTTMLITDWRRRGLLTPVAQLDRANIYRYADILAVEHRTATSRYGRNRRRTARAHPSLLKIDRTGTISDQMPAVDPALFQDVVYYVRFADRIKIGTTSNLPTRLAQIPHDELLVIEPGSLPLERLRQRQFADTLVAGQREWFTISNQLVEHVAMLLGHFGPASRLRLDVPVPPAADDEPRSRRKNSAWWREPSHKRR